MRTALALVVHDPAGEPLRAQELLLSGPAEGLPDQPVRRAVQRPAGTSTSRSTGAKKTRRHHARPHGGGRRQERAPRRGVGRRPQPRRASPLVEIVGEPDLRSGAEAAEYLRDAPRDPRLHRRQRRQPRGGELSLRRQREHPPRRARRSSARASSSRTSTRSASSRRPSPTRSSARARCSTAAAASCRRRAAGTRTRARPSACAARRRRRTTGTSRIPICRRCASTTPSSPACEAAMPELPRGEARAGSCETMGLTPYAAQVLTAHPQVAAFFEEAAGALREGVGRRGHAGRELHPERGPARRAVARPRAQDPGQRRRRSRSSSRSSTRGRSAASRPRRSTRRSRGTDQAPGRRDREARDARR